MREYKLVVLGSGGVGKSALTVKFVQNVFIDKYDPTIEDSYRKQAEIDNEQAFLEILDTAGTEQFTAMRDLYIKNGHGFLLVFALNSQSSLKDLITLRKQILQVKDRDNVPIILVGNKCDLMERTVHQAQAEQIAHSWGCRYFETSAKNDINVRDIFYEIVRIIRRELPEPKAIRRKKSKCALI